MGLLSLFFCSVGRCIDLICFLLDVNFVIVHSLIRLLVALMSFVNSLPVLLTSSLLECWNFLLVGLITAMDGVSVVTHNMVGGSQQLLGGLVEGFKMVGYLSSHILLRTRELMHRGLLSGHNLLRHMWEGCGIAVSLVLYLVNTVVNMLLIGTQNLYTIIVETLETVALPLQKILELTVTVLTFLYSSLVGTSLLVWTPCRLVMEFLGYLGQVFISVFLLNSVGLVLTVAVIVSASVYVNPEPFRRFISSVSATPTFQRLQRTLHRLSLLERGMRQRLVWPGSRVLQGAAANNRDTEVAREDIEGLEGQAADQLAPEDHVLNEERGEEAGGAGLLHQVPQQPDDAPGPPTQASNGNRRPLQKARSEEGPRGRPCDAKLLTLLQEQEERKKCVICQDSAKTVVLLPCRHLCLCRSCTDILLRQPIYQHNCPLCRHMILQTMDVYL
ncbi:E3 ubiquitin-protein ligase RNF26 [Denticeps clupeoides]|uniref:E3 ubiquitin-protein ligase RNF26 n=1 Tax=Denticeps clupeoides TaxID=299321 RepID=A0AAY4BV56_9TELE|nr:E3 ubiquitin-protein ligase RNF26 [Denticeps clupeoides]XP_028826583.1 E3 ubiquitin-protein ligase RNF26 [Denticeps clupeoides]